MAGNDRVRVFSKPTRTGRSFFACGWRSRRVVALGTADNPRRAVAASQSITAVRIAGDFVAYDRLRRCASGVCGGAVEVVNVRHGRRTSALGTPLDGQRVTALVLTRRGSAAWIRWAQDGRQLRKLDGDGEDLVVAGGALPPRMLRLRRSVLWWREGSRRKRLRLDAGRPCGARGSRARFSTLEARVFDLRDSVFGCLFARDRLVLLGPGPDYCFPDQCGVREVRIAGPFAAVAAPFSGRNQRVRANLRVLDLRDGATVHAWSGSPQGGNSATGRFELRDNGSIGWIGWSRLGEPSGPAVLKSDAEGEAVLLDSGPDLDPASLALEGTTLRWRNGRVERSAELR